MTCSSPYAWLCATLFAVACADASPGEPTHVRAGTTDAGGTTASVGGASAGTAPVETPLPPGNLAHGKQLVDQNACSVCHSSDYGGVGFNPNITPDEQFGIGQWTDAQVATAIVGGVASDGKSLCALMAHFPFSNQDVSDVVTFLRSLPAVTRANGSACPGHGATAR